MAPLVTAVTITWRRRARDVVGDEIAPEVSAMPRNEYVTVGKSPVQLTTNDVYGLFVFNRGPGSIMLAASPDDDPPADFAGPVVESGYAISASVLLTDIFPGVIGAKRVFAVATSPADASVFVSHA